METTVAAGGAQRTWRWKTLDLVIMTVVSFGLFLVLIIAVLAATGGLNAASGNPADQPLSVGFVLGLSAATVIALGAAVAAVSRWRGRTAEDLGLRPISGRTALWAALAAFGLRVAVIPLAALLVWLGLPQDNPQLAFLTPAGFDLGALLGTLVFAGVLIPFVEELFFRGVLYVWLRERWGVRLATLVSALVFGAIHGQVTLAVIAFALGLVTAVTYQRSGSLWASVIVHSVFNMLAIVLLYALLAAGVKLPGM